MRAERRAVLALFALLALAITPVGATGGAKAADARVHVSYQALPESGTGLPEVARLDYSARQRLSEQVAREIVPAALAALGLAPSAAATQVAPGGYLRRTDPSLVTSFAPGARAAALRFAAAMGYALRQDSVLVFAAEPQGGALAVTVAFASPLTPDLARRFFRHAGHVAPGLGGGFTAIGGDMLFINLRDGAGRPFARLDDAAFAAALQRASAAFVPEARIAGNARVAAALVGDGWAEGSGEAYVRLLDGLPLAALQALDLLGLRFADMLRAAAGRD